MASRRRVKPIWRFIKYLSMMMLVKPFAAAMPVTVPGITRRVCTIIVPGSAGWFVLRTLMGMRACTAGKIASSLNTPNPA